MNIEVRYQSKSGNTKQIAEAIAAAAGVAALPVENGPVDQTDILFLGGAIYAGGLSGKLKAFIRGLPGGKVKKIALFSTAMGETGIRPKVEKLLAGKNVELVETEFHVTSAEVKSEGQTAGEAAAQFARDILAEM